MFKRMLVPLDGSKRAERAIPVAARIARASSGSIILLQVVSTQIEFGTFITEPSVLMQQALEADLTRAIDYLAKIKMSNDLTGIETKVEVRSGAAALTMLDVAHRQHIDLIVMCSHGDTGFKRWVLGSVAQQVTRHSPVPILVLQDGGSIPTNSFPDPTRPLRALMGLVALDGSAFAEAALEPAAQLVAALAAPARGILLLTRVVKLPVIEREQAKAYLSDVAGRLRCGDISDLHLGIVTSVAVGKDVADALINVAVHGEDTDGTVELGTCDLIVMMATHGREGLQRWALGSVTERVLGNTKLPLLIVRSQEDQTTTEQKPTAGEQARDEVSEFS
jgi:nucleotide-binding universal stress UspA family protein